MYSRRLGAAGASGVGRGYPDTEKTHRNGSLPKSPCSAARCCMLRARSVVCAHRGPVRMIAKMPKILLSEGSSLSAREAITVLGLAGHRVELVSADALCLGRFSRFVSRVHQAPASGADPIMFWPSRTRKSSPLCSPFKATNQPTTGGLRLSARSTVLRAATGEPAAGAARGLDRTGRSDAMSRRGFRRRRGRGGNHER